MVWILSCIHASYQIYHTLYIKTLLQSTHLGFEQEAETKESVTITGKMGFFH